MPEVTFPTETPYTPFGEFFTWDAGGNFSVRIIGLITKYADENKFQL
jgi:hypothetical protein